MYCTATTLGTGAGPSLTRTLRSAVPGHTCSLPNLLIDQLRRVTEGKRRAFNSRNFSNFTFTFNLLLSCFIHYLLEIKLIFS